MFAFCSSLLISSPVFPISFVPCARLFTPLPPMHSPLLRFYHPAYVQDQYESVDLSDNDISKLENFPLSKRLRSLHMSNNQVSFLSSDLPSQLPSLRTLILTNNQIQNIEDLKPLKEMKYLEVLSLSNNPVCKKPNYRLFLIFHVPSLRNLDFTRINMKERQQAQKTYGVGKGDKKGGRRAKKSKTFEVGKMEDGGDKETLTGKRKQDEEEKQQKLSAEHRKKLMVRFAVFVLLYCL